MEKTAENKVNPEVIQVLERMLSLAKESDELFSVAIAFALGPEHGGKAIAGPLSMTLASVCHTLTNDCAMRPFEDAAKAQESANNGEAKPIEAAGEAEGSGGAIIPDVPITPAQPAVSKPNGGKS